MAASYNIVATLPSVDFYQVLRGDRTFLQAGPLAILQQAGVNYAQVGTIRWRIGADLPCLKSASNTYIFAVEGQPELFYSVVCPADAAASGLQVGLDNVLHNFTAFQDSSAGGAAAAGAAPGAAQVPSQTSRQVAEHMVKAGQLVAMGLVAAAQLAAHGIEKGSQMAVAKTTPAGQPMKPEVKHKLDRAASATSTAVTVTKAAASTLATFAGVAAHAISKHVENTDTAKKLAASKDVQVLRGAVGQAATDVGAAWQHAAHLVMQTSTAAGQAYIHHKYGAPAGAPAQGGAPPPQGGAPPPPYPGGPPPNVLQMQAAAAAVQPAASGHATPQQFPAQFYPQPATSAPGPATSAPAPYVPQQYQQQAPPQGQFYPAIPTGPATGTPAAPAPPGTPHPQQ